MTAQSEVRTEYILTESSKAFERAKNFIPAGLVSHIRRRDHQPVFTRGEGPYIWDVDGNRYIDTVCAHGPVMLGHAHPDINDAVLASVQSATQFGGSTPGEADLAELVLAKLPFADKVTFMTTGTEAVQLAIRIARTATGRERIVKFDGHYHGWIDPVYVNIPGYDPQPPAETKATTRTYEPIPVKSAVAGGTPPADAVIGKWNDIEHFRTLMEAIGDEIAAVIMEPLLTGFGTFAPAHGYLEELKEIAHQHGALLIFDEIVTGFRVAPGGASELLGVTPDIATYAKALANGFPIAMVAGTEAAMAPVTDGKVPAAGTYSGTPHCVDAAIATMRTINADGNAFYEHMNFIGLRLKDGVERVGAERSVTITANQIGPLVQVLWGDISDPQSVGGVYESNRSMVTAVMEQMIAFGVYTTRKGLFFLSRAHTIDVVDEIIDVFGAALDQVLEGR
jgi:glutamate-1-semialdehyde 2,1-aminomutase